MHISGAKTPLVEGDMAMPVSLFQTLHLSVIAFVPCLVTSLDTCSANIKAFIYLFLFTVWPKCSYKHYISLDLSNPIHLR